MTRDASVVAGIVAVIGTAACWPLGRGGGARAQDQPAATTIAGDARLRVVDYRPDFVLPLTAFVGYHIHLAFAPDEKFVNLAAGDSAGLDVGAEANHLLLKAKRPTAGTNLTILTTRRIYFVDYRALARAPRQNEAIYSIEFRYPLVPPGGARADDDLLKPASAVNDRYWFCGSPELQPVSARDDGVQLRLQFAPHAELPAIYASSTDGTESIVNTSIENDTLVLHRLAPRFVLRRGRLVGCVVNRADVAGRRASSGTVQDGVRRETVEVEP